MLSGQVDFSQASVPGGLFQPSKFSEQKVNDTQSDDNKSMIKMRSGILASKNLPSYQSTGERTKSKKLEKIERLAENIIGSPKETQLISEYSHEAESQAPTRKVAMNHRYAQDPGD